MLAPAGTICVETSTLPIPAKEAARKALAAADVELLDCTVSGNRGTASYGKPASVLRALRTILTPEVFDDAMRTYVRRWAFRHPHPLDLFWTFEDVSGRDLDWYFLPWMYTTAVMDHAVAEVRDEGDRQVIVVEDRGEIAMPIILEVSTDQGQTGQVMTAHDVWVDGQALIPVAMPGRVVEVVVDPEERFPDVNRADNRWTAERR